jgi:alpha/beta superfamily hydrolase
MGTTDVGPNIAPQLGAIATDGESVWVGDASGVARLDATTGEVVGRVSVGANGGVAADPDEVWISSYSSGMVAPLDESGTTVDASRKVAVDAPSGMALGLGSLWVTTPAKHLVTRIDTATGKPLALMPLNVIGPIVTGFGAAWASVEGGHSANQGGGLARIDPATNTSQLINLEQLGDSVPSALAVGQDSLFLGMSDAHVRRLDPVTFESEQGNGGARPGLHGAIYGMALHGTDLWLVGTLINADWPDYLVSPGTLVRMDSGTLDKLDTWKTTAGSNGAVIANDQLWSAVGFSTVERWALSPEAEPGQDWPLADTPGAITYEPDVTYSTTDDGTELPLDVLAPAEASNAPVVVILPGGPLQVQGRRYMAGLSAALAQEGAVVFQADYRSQATWDTELDSIRDVACAIGWARANAERYGGDPEHVVVAGHSHGSYLAIKEVASEAGSAGCDGQVEVPNGIVAIAGWPEVATIAPATDARMPVRLLVGTDDEALGDSSEVKEALEEIGFESDVTLVIGADHGAVIDGRNTVPTVKVILDTAAGS